MSGRVQPAREDVVGSPRLTIVDNAFAHTLLGQIRYGQLPLATFVDISRQLASIALLETGHNLPLQPATTTGFDGSEVPITRFAERIAGVVVLRAGLLFQAPFHDLLPQSALFQVGIRRNEETLEAEIYATNLPDESGWADRVYLMDPMLATGGTAVKGIEMIRQTHEGPIELVNIVAAPYGIQAVLNRDDMTTITTIAVDERLKDNGYILPGLGDVGDRYFGTT